MVDLQKHTIRPIRMAYNIFGYADASLVFEQGNTKILCSITLQQGVPPFLRGSGAGWLTAEYSMLPTSTKQRVKRDINQPTRNSRNVEISRIIGRSLRAVVDTSSIGERTIHIDCDVLQADGGTRAASITAATYALQLATRRWYSQGIIFAPILREAIAAISVGLVNGEVILDLDHSQDAQSQVDFNFVMTKQGMLVEVQGTAEKTPIDWQTFDTLRAVAFHGIAQLFHQADQIPLPLVDIPSTGKQSSRQDTYYPSL